MSRSSELLKAAADALDDGRDPLDVSFLDKHAVTFDECLTMAGLLSVGAQVVAWAIENPRIASAAFRGVQMETLLTLMEQTPGWGGQ